jgi:hypothetical protein
MDEPTTEHLTDLADGRLDDAAADQLRRLAVERGRTAELEWLERFVARAQRVVIADPPADVRRVLVADFEQWAVDRRRPSLVERIVGTLTFGGGGRSGPALAGVRGAAAAERQIVVSSESFDIAFHLFDDDGLVRVEGQVLSLTDELPEGHMEVRVGEVVVVTTPLDDLGEFAITGVPAGSYELVYTTSDREVTSGPLDFGGPVPGSG